MPELTLESLAARVEALERAAGVGGGETVVRGKHVFVVTPPTVDWATALAAADELAKTYDFDAFRERDEYEWEVARQLAAEAAQETQPERTP